MNHLVMAADSPSSRRFDIALSFPGEPRDFVEQVAGHLAAGFGRVRVLYDKYRQAEIAASDLDVYLPNLYRTQSEMIARSSARNTPPIVVAASNGDTLAN